MVRKWGRYLILYFFQIVFKYFVLFVQRKKYDSYLKEWNRIHFKLLLREILFKSIFVPISFQNFIFIAISNWVQERKNWFINISMSHIHSSSQPPLLTEWHSWRKGSTLPELCLWNNSTFRREKTSFLSRTQRGWFGMSHKKKENRLKKTFKEQPRQ